MQGKSIKKLRGDLKAVRSWRGGFAVIALLLAMASGVEPSVAGTHDAGGTHRTDDSEATREKIAALLSVRHPTDTAETWRGLGPQAPRVMIAMAGATDNPYERNRLLGALSFFGDDPEAMGFLRQQVDARETSAVSRAAAIRSLGAAQGAKELERIGRTLRDEDPDLRLAAAEALRAMEDSRADAVVSAWLKTERADWVRARIEGRPAGIDPRFIKRTESVDPKARRDTQFHPEFAGRWQGFRIRLAGTASSAPTDEAVVATFELDADAGLKGSLTTAPPLAKPAWGEAKVMTSAQSRAPQGRTATGEWKGLGFAELELFPASTGRPAMLEIRWIAQGVFVILKKR